MTRLILTTVLASTLCLFGLSFSNGTMTSVDDSQPKNTQIHTGTKTGTISADEERFMLDFLQETAQQLLTDLEACTPKQLTFRPVGGRWTIAECLEHILEAEAGVFGQVKKALAAPADPDLSTRHHDAWLIAKVSDRGTKVKTPIPHAPLTQTVAEMMEEFQAQRVTITNFLTTEDLPLRIHFGKSPYGPADAYQLMLVLAAHTMRHHHQIQEILQEYHDSSD